MFRESPEGREVMAEGSRDGQTAVVRMCVEAGKAWQLLSKEEKEVSGFVFVFFLWRGC